MNARLHPMVKVLGVGALGFLYLPMIAVAIFSVNDARYGLVWRGFTLSWYQKLISNSQIMEAMRNTFILAVVSTIVSTTLGTLLAIGMARFPWRGGMKKYLNFTVYLPIVTPDIIFAAAAVVIFGVLRSFWSLFDPGLVTMILAHITFQIVFVALVVQSRLASIGASIEEAARDLYADTPGVYRRVILPLLMPGIAAGSMLAFTLSLDDFIVSFFTAGPASTTLPIYIYASVRRGVTPEIHALSTLIFLLTVLLVFGLERLTRFRGEAAR